MDHEAPSQLRTWLQCITLIGQAHYPVVMHDPAVLARCVSTLGALLWCGQADQVIRPDDGKCEDSTITGTLWQRACYLQPGADWDCLAELLHAIEHTVKEQRELLRKCHHEIVQLESMGKLLDTFGQSSPGSRLKAREVKGLVDTFYAVAHCKEQKVYNSGKEVKDDDDVEEAKPPLYMRGQIHGSTAGYSVAAVTCALGRQLLRERDQLCTGMD